MERPVQPVHWTAEIFSCRWTEITTGCANRESRRGRGPTFHRSILPGRMGLEHLVGRHDGPLG